MALYSLPPALQDLVAELNRLPGIGRKTALRLALHILNSPKSEAEALASAVLRVKEKIHLCSVCFNITEQDPCDICRDTTRNRRQICVVEDAPSILMLEKTNEYHGLYHVLGGVISPLDGIGPEDLRIKELLHRIRNGVQEVILANNPSVEGEATALYLVKLIKPLGIKVSQMARGLPMGGDLEWADALTLTRALEGRRELE